MPTSSRDDPGGARKTPAERIDLAGALPFVLAHLACLAAIWTGVYLTDVLIGLGLFWLRMFAVTAGYHRYFSHRSFKTGRIFQFLLAFVAQSSAQRGVLWWAATHRHHHRYSDTDEDVHSPVRRSFLYSHMGWIFSDRHQKTNLAAVPDLAKYPELLWLDRHPYVPAIVLGTLVWLAAGWPGLVVGFFWSTVVLWHATFSINSLAHVYGRKRYLTGDQSRNNWWLALITLGEGWHNNHHHYQSAACQGFRWYEIDISYYILKGLAAVGLVHDLKRPPESVVRNEQRLGRAVVEKAAAQLAASFPVATIAAELRERLRATRASIDASIDGIGQDLGMILERWQAGVDDRLDAARHEIEELAERVHLPALPTAEDLRARATSMFASTPSMNEIVERARQMLLERLHQELVTAPGSA